MHATFITEYSQIQLWGSLDHDSPEWRGPVAYSLGGLLIGTAHYNEPFSATFEIENSPTSSENIYFQTVIDVPKEGIELCLLEEADIDMESGTVGSYLPLPWRGKTLIQLNAPSGFEENLEGRVFPKSLIIYLSQVRQG